MTPAVGWDIWTGHTGRVLHSCGALTVTRCCAGQAGHIPQKPALGSRSPRPLAAALRPFGELRLWQHVEGTLGQRRVQTRDDSFQEMCVFQLAPLMQPSAAHWHSCTEKPGAPLSRRGRCVRAGLTQKQPGGADQRVWCAGGIELKTASSPGYSL